MMLIRYMNLKTFGITLEDENPQHNWKLCMRRWRAYASWAAKPVQMLLLVKHDKKGDIGKVMYAKFVIVFVVLALVRVKQNAAHVILGTISR